VAQVFTSYSRKDKDFVRKLSDAFANQKRDTWIDWKDIPLTAEWQQEILTNIEGAENFLRHQSGVSYFAQLQERDRSRGS
jgi:TIR domain